jgi:hypothetical protein
MNKFLTIAKAWGIAVFHTDEQKALADERMEECNKCENLQEVDVKNMTGGVINNYFLCGACGCPMQGKMYTPKDAPNEHKCPKNKWKEQILNLKS